MLETGTIVEGRYKVLGELGRGGTGIVYLALDEKAGGTWAIKMIDRETAADFELIRRKLQVNEGDLIKFCHRYLPLIAAVIQKEDAVLIVMEYIEGRTLKEILQESMLKDGRPLPVKDVAVWGIQLCEVLNYLHTYENPMIYGDLKPGNVMVRPDGRIVLLDFGTVRYPGGEWKAGRICLGTPGYAAPEQYGNSKKTGPWTDIFALGATLHYLLTGRDPSQTLFYFPGILDYCPELNTELSRRQRLKYKRFDKVIERCTRYTVEERYLSCEEVQHELEGIAGTKGNGEGRRYRHLFRTGLYTGAVIAVLVSGLFLMAGYSANTRYNSYIANAQLSNEREKTELLRQAVILNPYRHEAYTVLLDTLVRDNLFSADDERIITEILYSRGEKRKKDNLACLQENTKGYMIFSYKLGMAYYYLTEDPGSRIRAGRWLEIVAGADMKQVQLGEYDSEKWEWQALAALLGRFISHSREAYNQTESLEKCEASWRNYWEDIKTFMGNNLQGEELSPVKLRLYQDIVIRLMEGAADFKRAGIGKEELDKVLDDIFMQISVPAGEDETEDLMRRTGQAIENTRKTIEAVYSGTGRQEYEEE